MTASHANTSPSHPGHDLTRGTEAETKPTPGPWEASGVDVFGASPARDLVVECRNQSMAYEEREANARLIAAAPLLLSAALIALEQIQRTFQLVQLTPSLDDGLCTAKDELRDAINQALNREQI